MDIDLRHEIHQVQSALDDLYEEAARQIIGIAGAYAEDDDDPDVPSYADAVVDEVVASIQRSIFDIEGATANKIAVRGMIYKAIAARVNELDQTGDEMVYRSQLPHPKGWSLSGDTKALVDYCRHQWQH